MKDARKDVRKKVIILKVKIIHEIKRYVFYTSFLFLFLSAFIIYRKLILQQYGIVYTHYGMALIEAVVLAKVIMIGEIFGFDKHFPNRPLIVPVLYNSLIFSIIVLAFMVFEELFLGYLHGHDISVTYRDIVGRRIPIVLANIFIMLFVFIPFFSIIEIRKIIGEGKLFNLFFRQRDAKSLHHLK